MGSPSRRSLLAATLAADGPSKPVLASESDTPTESLVKIAADLKERIAVLQILDGSAPQWPGITACIDMLYEVAGDASEGLQRAHRRAHESSTRLKELEVELDKQKGRADEAEDALAACDTENNELTKQFEQHGTTITNLKSELAHERADKERKVCI